MAITLTDLRLRCRERADMESSQFVTDTELTYYINSSIAELHDLLIQCYGEDYYVKKVTFNTTANQDEYAIATVISAGDFYKLRGVDAKINTGEWFSVQQFNFNERNRFQNTGTWSYLGLAQVRYRLVGDKIMFTPVPETASEVRLWYIPKATTLVNGSDSLDDINYYAEYIITDVAIKMLTKEESDPSVHMAVKEQLKQRIESSAKNRDAGNPSSISDIYSENTDYFFRSWI